MVSMGVHQDDCGPSCLATSILLVGLTACAMQAAKAKAKAKAPSIGDSAGARVDRCAWCDEKRQGWCDRLLVFYCEHCWTEYDTLQAAGGEDYAGRVWHDEILEEDNIAAEDEDEDGVNYLELAKNAVSQIESDKKDPTRTGDADGGDDSDDELNEKDDKVKELPKVLGVAGQIAESELQQAHVIVIVDTSGSMRTNDVRPEKDVKYIRRMAAVTLSLSTFFEKRVQACCPHRFRGSVSVSLLQVGLK